MAKESLAQKRFFDALYKQPKIEDSALLSDDDDRSRFGLSAYLGELMDVESQPSRDAVKPYLKNPEKEQTGFILSLSTVLQENPKLIDIMSEQKMKISSQDVPDPEAGKPFQSETSDAWDKAIKKHIIDKSNQQKIATRIAEHRRSHSV